jgi:hypothetical protein
LSNGSVQRPYINGTIDLHGDNIGDDLSGWNGTEYSRFTNNIPMFIGGKNWDPKFKAGIAHLAYDCHNYILCGAAYLNAASISKHAPISTSDSESWIRIGGENSDPKLKQSNALDFKYVEKPSWVAPSTDGGVTIGYEGCWNTTGLIVMNNFIEIHFSTSGGNTISSGKVDKSACFKCVSPTPSPSPPTTVVRRLRGV